MSASRGDRPGEAWVLLGAWLILAGAMAWWPMRDLSAPGLYYDEATYAGQAKDFLLGRMHGQHMPGTLAVPIFGRPFPLFSQPYLGAVKAWLTVPALAIFGFTTQVVRMSSLAWSSIALLLIMLWARALLGIGGALLVGALLALDPSYVWMTTYDWGPVVPGFLARAAAFLLLARWWRSRRWTTLFLAAVCLGLGMQHKLDFVVVLAGVGAAALLAYGRELQAAFAGAWRQVVAGMLGFLLGMGPMLGHAIRLAPSKIAGATSAAESGLGQKLRTLVTLYDGSYFARLMRVGGDFQRMFAGDAPARGVFGLAVAAALVAAIVLLTRRGDDRPERRSLLLFLVAGLLLQTLGVFLLPNAVRIHHALLVYPFPHLLVAAVLAAAFAAKDARRAAIVASLLVVATLAGQLRVLAATASDLHASGGRGWWSDAIGRFADEVRRREDLTVLSLDWGFDEQLLFLTEGPQLGEPFWLGAPALTPAALAECAAPDRIYLVHPPGSTLLPFGPSFLRACQAAHPARLWVRPYRDRAGAIAFFAVRFAPVNPPRPETH